MSTVIHEIAPEEIMAHYDGELPADRAEAVSAHLENCTECRTLAESFDAASQSLTSWKVEDAPSTLQPNPATADMRGPGLSWQLLRNRRVALTLGLVFSTILFVFFEISGNYSSGPRRAALEQATRVDINNYVPGRAEPGGGGGGYGGSPPSKGKAPHFDERIGTRLNVDPAQGIPEANGIAAPSTLLGPENVLVRPVPTNLPDTPRTASEFPLIARIAELQITVKKFDDARTALQSVLARHHGYAASLHVGDTENTAPTLNASLRIPSQELSAALNELKALGHVTNESQGGEEVTAEHADLVAQLKNSRETETRLQDILRNRTGKVSDVLEVEQEIARVRGEIEQAESELKSMDHRVSFATITLTLTEEYKAKVSESTPSISVRFRNAAIAGYENVASSALGLILWFVEYFPPIIFWLVLLGGPAWWLWRRTQRALASVA